MATCDDTCRTPRRAGEYVFDHRNESLQKWFLEEYIGGPEGIGSEDISGMYVSSFLPDSVSRARSCVCHREQYPLCSASVPLLRANLALC